MLRCHASLSAAAPPGHPVSALRAGLTARATPALRAGLIGAALALLGHAAVALDTLEFETPGAEGRVADRLRGASLLLRAQAEDRTTPEDLLSAARAEYRTLTGVLYGAGHYGGSVSVRVDGREASAISPLSPPARIGRITVSVAPGPAFTFGTTSVRPLPAQTALPDGFAPDQPAEAGLIADAAAAAVESWREAGHPKATLRSQSVTANHRSTRLNAQIVLAPGPQLRFAAPSVSGNTNVRAQRIRDIAGLPVGAVFSPQALETSAARLRRSGAFRSVSLSEGAQDGDTLPIDITVVEATPRRFGFGAELSSLDGLTLSAFWLHRNLRGGAERLRVDAELAQIGGENADGDATADLDIKLRYQRPATFTPDTDLYLETELYRIDEPNFLASGLSFGGGVDHIFSDRLTGSAGVELSTTRTEDDLGARDFVLLSLPAGLTWEGRDVPLDATSGLYADLSLTPFVALSGTDNGVALEFDGRAYRGFGAQDRFVLAGRVQLGSLIGPELARAPSDMLYFAGGGGSVRGHAYQSLGVTGAGGARTGGRSLLVLSAELRARITDSIGIVAFSDSGFVGADSLPGDDGAWITGAGIGARYQTPIGPLRLDVAAPVSGGDPDGGVQLYIGIGQAF